MKKLVFILCYVVGITRWVSWWNRKQVMVLCYHGVTERAERNFRDPHGLHVRQDRFAVQLDYLQRYHRVISLHEYLAARREGRLLPHYSVILTFDDGYRNFLTVAVPYLAKYTMYASVFLITDRMGEDNNSALISRWKPSDDEIYLSWAEVQALGQRQSIEFGSHTCSHSKLPTLSPKKAECELRDSYAAIVAHLKSETVALAYPYGEYSDLLARQACSLGYVCALTTDGGFNDENTDLFKLRRTLIGDDDDEPAFAARVSGLAEWLVKAQAFLRRIYSWCNYL
ncbi:MAG: polysaccharide deacetylase family protein [Nitrososphaera sp.]|nr:polysaccharide deacetylase family protein [Nitrososphaera sp.]